MSWVFNGNILVLRCRRGFLRKLPSLLPLSQILPLKLKYFNLISVSLTKTVLNDQQGFVENTKDIKPEVISSKF